MMDQGAAPARRRNLSELDACTHKRPGLSQGNSPHEYLTGPARRQTGPIAGCVLLRRGAFFGEHRSAQDVLKLLRNRSPGEASCRFLRR